MQTAVRKTERRVSNTAELIRGVCRQFSDATGWPMHFTPIEENAEEQDWLSAPDDSSCCWRGEIHDGRRLIGYLSLDLPADSVQDHAFLTVRSLAELIAELLNRLCSTARVLESRTREVSTLVELGLTVPRESDVLDAVLRLLRAVTRLTGFRATGFFLLDPSTSQLNLRLSHHLDAQRIPEPHRDLKASPPDLRALMTGTAWLRRDHAGDHRWLPDGAAIGVGVAVETHAGPIGTLWAFDRRLRSPSDRELHILRSLAAQIALILERVVLLKESESQHRIQRELRLVSENQPHPLLDRLPPDCGFDVALHIDSRHELGGDLCELIPIGERRTIIVIGDASGDSIPAAIVMTSVRGALRALTVGVEDDMLRPDVVLDRVNRALYSITPAHQFMSFLYGVFDGAKRTFTYSNAGHPVPLLIRDGDVTPLESHGVILGVTDKATYAHSQLELNPGDTLVFYTDGISEAMDREHRMFRTEGILAAVRERPEGTAREILDVIWKRYLEHIHGAAEPDDRTLLVIQAR